MIGEPDQFLVATIKWTRFEKSSIIIIIPTSSKLMFTGDYAMPLELPVCIYYYFTSSLSSSYFLSLVSAMRIYFKGQNLGGQDSMGVGCSRLVYNTYSMTYIIL